MNDQKKSLFLLSSQLIGRPIRGLEGQEAYAATFENACNDKKKTQVYLFLYAEVSLTNIFPHPFHNISSTEVIPSVTPAAWHTSSGLFYFYHSLVPNSLKINVVVNHIYLIAIYFICSDFNTYTII